MYAHVKIHRGYVFVCEIKSMYMKYYEFMVKSIKASYIRMYSIRLQRY